MADAMRQMQQDAPILPTVKEIIVANGAFERGLQDKMLCHMGQPSLTAAASNCDKRLIGSNGGFGYRSIREDVEIAILDSVILAHWACVTDRVKKKQKIRY